MAVIVLANLKGGVTKTTTTINVAMAASLLGKRVLVVDTDLQGNASTALGYEPSALEHTTYTLMLGKSSIEDAVLSTYFDKTTKRFVDPTDKEIMHNRRIRSENLVSGPDLLPCNVAAAQAENDLIRNPAWGSLLRNTLQNVRQNYDYIFIDTHPDLGKMTVNSFIAADSIVIPLVPEPWPTDGLLVLSASIADAQTVNSDLHVSGILFTRVRYAEHIKLMEYVRDTLVLRINDSFPTLDLSCFMTSVNESASFITSTNRRSCVVLSHPTDAVALSYWAFFVELLQKEKSDDFAAAYEQFQQLLRIYKAREQEKAGAKQKA